MKRLNYLILSSLFIFNGLNADDISSSDPLSAEEEFSPFSPIELETLFETIDTEEVTSLVEPSLDALPSEPIVQESVIPILETLEEPKIESASTLLILEEPKKEMPKETLISSLAEEPEASTPFSIKIDFKQVFSGSPWIYSTLFLMSIVTLFIWLYSQIHLRLLGNLPESVMKNLRNKLSSNQYEDALTLCQQNDSLFCKMLASGILNRKHGLQTMMETMKSEGKRASVKFWQRIALLNDIAIIAPMLGLLGTVLGMFYAFYDVNRSVESVSALFDGLGISVGTTVAGLLVAIIAMILYSIARYRLVRRLALVENEVHHFVELIDNRSLKNFEG